MVKLRAATGFACWLGWLLVLGGVRGEQPGQCQAGCTATVEPVCGENKHSYTNQCVAECAGVTVASQGYCKGTKLRFIDGNAPMGPPREAATIIPASVLTRYAVEGYTYLGRVELSPFKHLSTPSGGDGQGGGGLPFEADEQQPAADTSLLEMSLEELQHTMSVAMGLTPVTTPDPPADGIAPVAAAAASTPSAAPLPTGGVQVSIQRATSSGDVYTRTYSYMPGARTSYPPHNPKGTQLTITPERSALESSKLPAPPTAPANKPAPSKAAAAEHQQQAFKAAEPAGGRGGGQATVATAKLPTSRVQVVQEDFVDKAAKGSAGGGNAAAAAKATQAARVATSTAKAAAKPGASAATKQAAASAKLDVAAAAKAAAAARAAAAAKQQQAKQQQAKQQQAKQQQAKQQQAKQQQAKQQQAKQAAAAESAAAVKLAALPKPASAAGAKQQPVAASAQSKKAGVAAAGASKKPAAAKPKSKGARRLQQQVEPAPLPAGDALHRMLTVIGGDDRQRCPSQQWPLTAVGQLSSRSHDGQVLCTGVMIGRQRLLTAAHCVWDDRAGSGTFLQDLSFAPGTYKTLTGEVVRPAGTIGWESVTVFSQYVEDSKGVGAMYDVAVITLTEPVGDTTGWLGYRAECGGPDPVRLVLAGYPSDRGPNGWGAPGGCLIDACSVNYNCNALLNSHSCDSYVGQSGSGMYDDQYFVRVVHTLGVYPGQPLNAGITLTPFLVDAITAM